MSARCAEYKWICMMRFEFRDVKSNATAPIPVKCTDQQHSRR
jgi:hypothetical protein